ncbi:hypothetical protein CSB93_4863 [Pseudomonas paraeruginosa]|uniref:Uncharacterized protein n=1 Tax=Pseudomonas paraeruginosa TaxID=2994495 RepID=A0A2R3IPY3_9PSED|nr:hypothetical protein CSB93_4863 [Pseudomonas paraeruginosa]AWE92648.1 hypothetical protein CSC28_3653 [Pseudomonas paraeruginosa]PTC35891.1 hypothetical protein CLJ1_3376 [Pseudomonas aeruginosa]
MPAGRLCPGPVRSGSAASSLRSALCCRLSGKSKQAPCQLAILPLSTILRE